MVHKEFKCLYNTTNRQEHTIAQQILSSWVPLSMLFGINAGVDGHVHSDSDDEVPRMSALPQIAISSRHAFNLVQQLSGSALPSAIARRKLDIDAYTSSPASHRHIWRSTKRLDLSTEIPRYNDLLYTSVFSGDQLYGTRHRHDAVLYSAHNTIHMAIWDSSRQSSSITTTTTTIPKLVLLRRLVEVYRDHGNCSIVHNFGHLRYGYSISTTELVRTILIPSTDVLQPAVLVVDGYWLKNANSLHHRFDSICWYCTVSTYPLFPYVQF